jgi:N-methylhydantoinase A
MAYLGVDIGGTFTDVVFVGDDGDVTATKVSSTPPRFEHGFLAGVEKVAGLRGATSHELLSSCDVVLHGTTVATNAVVEMRGARVGVITTRGHRDTMPVMRASGRAKGLTVHDVLHSSRHTLPRPLADPTLILEVDERVDSKGAVVVALQEDQVADAARRLVDAGVDAISICFLWSIAKPAHEQRAREIVEGLAPGLFVCCSHEASARLGEYERFTAATLNAFLGPETRGYVTRLKQGLVERGLSGRLVIMQASGGVASDERAARLPALTIGSGPSAGVTASLALANERNEENVIATDMGGTSFDVALISAGAPVGSASTVVNQFEFFLPRTDIRSIGSGGGSIIWFDEASKTLKVGPASAGADPGPVCYGRGGTRPTVTDANLLLGYLNPENFLGGEIVLDLEAGEQALAEVGDRLGISALDAAAAARRIVEAQMADLIRQMTVERGVDPRGFALYAYGGAGGLHVAGYLRELGCERAVIPLGTLSTTWSAYGCATSDLLQVHERAVRMVTPLPLGELRQIFEEIEVVARRELAEDGIPADRQSLQRSLEMKYPLQIHQVEVQLGEGSGASDTDTTEDLVRRFTDRYEQLYGRGSAWEGAGIVEVVACRVVARGSLLQPEAHSAGEADTSAGEGERLVHWVDADGTYAQLPTRVIPTEAVSPGAVIEGPAIIEADTTTVVVPPGAIASATPHGDLTLQLQGADTTAMRVRSGAVA